MKTTLFVLVSFLIWSASTVFAQTWQGGIADGYDSREAPAVHLAQSPQVNFSGGDGDGYDMAIATGLVARAVNPGTLFMISSVDTEPLKAQNPVAFAKLKHGMALWYHIPMNRIIGIISNQRLY